MTDTKQVESTIQYPFVHIEQQPDPDTPGGFQFAIQAGGGITDTDHIVTLLLLITEQLTGVKPDLYAREIELTRRIARGEPLFGALGDSDLDEE